MSNPLLEMSGLPPYAMAPQKLSFLKKLNFSAVVVATQKLSFLKKLSFSPPLRKVR